MRFSPETRSPGSSSRPRNQAAARARGAQQRRALRRGGLILACCLAAATAAAEGGGSLLLGPGQQRPEDPTPDQSLPSGPPLGWAAARPTTAEAALCTARGRACVHAVGTLPSARWQSFANAFGSAYERAIDALRLPAPRSDGGAGGTQGLDLYVLAGSSASFRVETDEPGLGRFDSAAGHCVVGADAEPIERAATRCVAELIALGLAPAEAPEVREGYALHLTQALGGLTATDIATLEDVQMNPQLGVAGFPSAASARAATAYALFFDFLSRRAGAGVELPTAILSLVATSTPGGASRWHHEPDLFDVVRASFRAPQGGGLPSLLADFAAARLSLGVPRVKDDRAAFLTPRPESRFGNLRFDWSVPASSLPRNLALLRPLAPTGSTYLWVDLDVPVPTLGFHAEWEEPAGFLWSVLQLDAEGRVLRRRDLPYLERASSIEEALVVAEEARAVVVVGTHLGGLWPHPFDPDAGPFEPHGATVYLVPL